MRFFSRPLRCGFLIFITVGCAGFVPLVGAQTLDVDAVMEERDLGLLERLVDRGEWDLCVQVGEVAAARGMRSPRWAEVRVEALQRLGRLEEALKVLMEQRAALPDHLPMALRQHAILSALGRKEEAMAVLREVNAVAQKQPPAKRTAADWVALGQAALAAGADAKQVIARYYQVARRLDPKSVAAYLAEGRLALEKWDPAQAAKVFQEGFTACGEGADLRQGLAAAYWMSGDAARAEENVRRVLEMQPNHVGALLIQAEQALRAEKFLDAEAAIQLALDQDADLPEAWAMRAAVALITTPDAAAVERARQAGLRRWKRNPNVDHTLGRLVSRAYRFADGAACQQRALEMDPDFIPAKAQLCEDLLRLGREEEAWQWAAQVRAADGYHVGAFNLGKLEQEMQSFHEERRDGFTLRLPQRDWAIYGERALQLLVEARRVLGEKYGVSFERDVLVEFFPSQQDFAMRTFGRLGGQGILGACFGTVVTMNSPGSLAHGRNNWEATLWHEFCHVVTLTATRNRMPRWLSEGISVYEEGVRDPVWEMRMTAEYREMVEAGKAIPVSQLSRAFLGAESSEDLMFGYYQSGQVVAELVERHGASALRQVLQDLAAGMPVNEALQRHTTSMADFEAAVDARLRARAAAFGKGLDWAEPAAEEVNPADLDSLRSYAEQHPNNVWVQRRMLAAEAEAEQWEAVEKRARALVELAPEDGSTDAEAWQLAEALRHLDRPDEERRVLERVASRDAGMLSVLLRLQELAAAAGDEKAVRWAGERLEALNPFLRTPWEARARAAEALGDWRAAASDWEKVLLLQPPSPGRVHYDLARLWQVEDRERARSHVMEALLAAPRFRQAHRLLLKLEP